MKVSLFITCLSDILFPNVARDTMEILQRVGCTVNVPMNQTCCGQPVYNSGYVEKAKGTLKLMIDAFKDAEYVVGPSGSCVSMIRQYPQIFAQDPKWENPARELAEKTYELTQFLVDVLGVTDVGSTFSGKVTYHPSCHMTRLLGVKDAPRILLEHIEGVELVDLAHAEDCCGFGGMFSVKNPHISTEMVKEKVKNIANSGAEYLTGGDMGCLMNIAGRMRREGKTVQVVHITKILNTTA